MAERSREVFSAKDLSLAFVQESGGMLQVIQELNLRVCKGELVAVIGASGSGKSLLAHSILGILPRGAELGGEMFYLQEPLTPRLQQRQRGKGIVLVPQSVAFLDPLMRVGPQVHQGSRKPGVRQRADQVLARYGLAKEVQRQYPFELSGGMARRVLISTAVMESPQLVIADEPTPGLHSSIARRVLGHFRELADDGAGVLLITHDLELALEVADRVVVLYAGTVVEDAAAADFRAVETLRHPYSRALWRAMPQNGFHSTPGTQPYAGELPDGCRFMPRCPQAVCDCRGQIPWRRAGDGFVRCILAGGEEDG